MAYAHAQGVVHRDLKPENVMTGAFGEVHVVDWGFARVLPGFEGEGVTFPPEDAEARAVLGTPPYMPPEQARGLTVEMDGRSDVFSLGAILLEILTGQPPYTEADEDLMEQARKGRLEDAYRRLDACGADAELVEICRTSLSIDPRDRPRDGSELASAITRHLASAESRAHRARVRAIEEESEASRARLAANEARAAAQADRKKRRQTLLLAAAVLLAILIGGGAWSAIAGARADRERQRTLAVEEALRTAGRRFGLEDWTGVAAAARSALDLAGDGDLRDAAASLLTAAEAELRDTLATAARVAADEAMARRLREIRFRGNPEEYARAFREYGIDIEAIGPAAAGAAIQSSAIRMKLVDALDAWASLGRVGLDEILAGADEDPIRNRLRQSGEQELRRLAAEADLAATSPRTALLSGMRLASLGDPEAAVDLLWRTYHEHPREPWIHHELAGTYVLAGDEAESIRHRMAVVALLPSSVEARRVLGKAHYRADKHTAAVRSFEGAVALTVAPDPHDCLFLAVSHARLGHEKDARHWYGKSASAGAEPEEIRELRAEAAALLRKLEDR